MFMIENELHEPIARVPAVTADWDVAWDDGWYLMWQDVEHFALITTSNGCGTVEVLKAYPNAEAAYEEVYGVLIDKFMSEPF